MTRNIGIKVKTPKDKPEEGDKKNPFNGTLPVRGKLFEGKVVKAKGKNTVVPQKKHQYISVNSKDMEEVKTVFMHTFHLTLK